MSVAVVVLHVYLASQIQKKEGFHSSKLCCKALIGKVPNGQTKKMKLQLASPIKFFLIRQFNRQRKKIVFLFVVEYLETQFLAGGIMYWEIRAHVRLFREWCSEEMLNRRV